MSEEKINKELEELLTEGENVETPSKEALEDIKRRLRKELLEE